MRCNGVLRKRDDSINMAFALYLKIGLPDEPKVLVLIRFLGNNIGGNFNMIVSKVCFFAYADAERPHGSAT